MALNLNLGRIKGPMDELKNTAFAEVPAGRGMVLLKEFKEYGFTKGRNPGHELHLEIVAWTDPAGVAQMHREIIFEDDGSRDDDICAAKLMRIAIAVGLFTPAQAEQMKATGTLELDLNAAQNRPMFCEIIKRKDKDGVKEYTNVAEGGFAYFHVKDPRCKDWPKHAMLLNQSLALVGEWEPLKKSGAGTGGATGTTPTTPAAKPNPFAGRV